jgi:hypothetical protein
MYLRSLNIKSFNEKTALIVVFLFVLKSLEACILNDNMQIIIMYQQTEKLFIDTH